MTTALGLPIIESEHITAARDLLDRYQRRKLDFTHDELDVLREAAVVLTGDPVTRMGHPRHSLLLRLIAQHPRPVEQPA